MQQSGCGTGERKYDTVYRKALTLYKRHEKDPSMSQFVEKMRDRKPYVKGLGTKKVKDSQSLAKKDKNLIAIESVKDGPDDLRETVTEQAE